MPSPTPIPTSGGPAAFDYPMDCVRLDDPLGTSPLPFGNQRWEIHPDSTQMDSKLLKSENIIPWRFIDSGTINGATDWWTELSGNPAYWQGVAWGAGEQFDQFPDGHWGFANPIPFLSGFYLVASAFWLEVSTPLFGPPAWNLVPIAFQVVNHLYTSRYYEIWTVTGRWLYQPIVGDVGYDATGTFPSPYPWSSSSDFAMLSSGTLNPGESLIVGPPDFDPDSNCQKPPAASTIANTTDGEGWGVGAYIVYP